jgi:hypothetical protein
MEDDLTSVNRPVVVTNRRFDWAGIRRVMPWAAVAIVFLVDLGMWVWAFRGLTVIPNYPYDFELYRDATQRWLAGGGFYHAYQVGGPYQVWAMDPMPIMYPPPFILFMLPFTVLPLQLWTAIPVVGTAMIVTSHRPSRVGWLIVAGLAAYPGTYFMLSTANPALWIVFFCALATRWPFFGPFVLLKPTLAPWSLVGIWSRWWWIGLAALAFVSLAFLPMWRDYVVVVLNAREEHGLLYGVWNNVTIAIPVVAALTGGAAVRSFARPVAPWRLGLWLAVPRLGRVPRSAEQPVSVEQPPPRLT